MRRVSWFAIPLTVVALAASGLSPAAGPEAQGVTLEGTYTCVGQSPDGGRYHGKVRITRDGEKYGLGWKIGDSAQMGVGLLDGNRLSCSWAVLKEPDDPEAGFTSHGVVVYRVVGNHLEGRFLQYPGTGDVLVETLTKIEE